MSGYLFDPSVDMNSPVNSMTPQYQTQLEQTAPGITQIVSNQQAPDENWFDSLARLLPTLAATYQQKQLLDVQVQRARNGQAPLNVSNYAPGFNVGVNQDTQKMLLYAGLGLAALFVFSILMKKKG